MDQNITSLATTKKQVVTKNMAQHGQIREFDLNSDDWTIFSRRLENYFIAYDIGEMKRKAILLNALTKESYKLMFNLCLPEMPENLEYRQLIEIFNDHFKEKQSMFAYRYKFYSAQKAKNENVANWAARVIGLATYCEFGSDIFDMMLRDKFIVGFQKGDVQDRLFKEKKTSTFVDAIKIANMEMERISKSKPTLPTFVCDCNKKIEPLIVG